MASVRAERMLWIGCLAALAAAAAAGVFHFTRSPDLTGELGDANPGWRFERAGHGHIAVTETASGARLLISDEEAGAHVIARVPCEEMARAHPPWFRLPPAPAPAASVVSVPPSPCVRLTSADHDVYVTNFRTGLGVPEIWTGFYEPLVSEYPFDASGGGSTSSSTSSKRFASQIGYGIAPRQPDGGREAHLAAFYVERQAIVVLASGAKSP